MSTFVMGNRMMAFTVLVFVISYLGGIPFNMWVSGAMRRSTDAASEYLPRLVTVLGPAISAIIVTVVSSGRSGLALLLRKTIPVKDHAVSCFALPLAGLLVAGFALIAAGIDISVVTGMLRWHYMLFLVHLIVQVLLIGFGEELGWRGWMLPELLPVSSPARATLLVALVWGIWHAPLYFMAPRVALPHAVLIGALSVIFTWLWHRAGGNIFVLAIAHGSVNAPVSFYENCLRNEGYGTETSLPTWGLISVIYAMLAVFLLLSRRRWWLQSAEERDLPAPNG